jgi:hypothetical protein
MSKVKIQLRLSLKRTLQFSKALKRRHNPNGNGIFCLYTSRFRESEEFERQGFAQILSKNDASFRKPNEPQLMFIPFSVRRIEGI